MAKKRKYTRKLKQIKTTSKDHYYKFRTKKGYVKKKPRGQFIVEVFSRKTKKRIGVLNKVKNNKPVPRKYTKVQLTIKTQSQRAKPRAKKVKEITFKIYSHILIKTQIEKKVPKIKKLIKDVSGKDPGCFIGVHLFFSDGINVVSNQIYFEKKASSEEITKAITINAILDSIHTAQVRMSPKKYARNENYEHKKAAKVRLFGFKV